jgi:serine phosphatase RsbU (regulator of sigma subunit)
VKNVNYLPESLEVWPEDLRLAALYDLKLLDTPPEPAFDRITRLLRRIFDAPVALVTLVDQDRQWFKSCDGLEATETSRSVSFCAHAIQAPNRPLVILDASRDERFFDSALVRGLPGIRFYAGAVLRAPNGAPVGTVCIIDTAPREKFSERERETLLDIAALAGSELQLRETASELVRQVEEVEAANSRLLEENDRHERELMQAVEAQKRILPPSYRRLESAEAYAVLVPSRGLSGDSYGYGRLNDDAGFFWIADVVGHGVSAALLSATLSRVITGEMLMAAAKDPPSPPDVLKRLNGRLIHPGEEEHSYFTMIYGMIDRRNRRMKMAIAGHPQPLLMLPGEKPILVEGSGLPLALFDRVDYDLVEVDFPPGARLLSYSDGISECETGEGEPFETDRLECWMDETRDSDPAVALTDLKRRLRDWRGQDSYADDITAVLIERGAMPE